MPPKVRYKEYKRNTLLEELGGILHEYPDNEQIIKEILQNAEDAGASVVKIAYCPHSESVDLLPAPYKEYLAGPGLCFYNDQLFSDDDWDGITMVRKSIKQNDPLKVGKFGIGFKSIFHVTDFVCVISGENILFIDPLQEKNDPSKICPFNTLKEYGHPDICGPHGLQPLYGKFGVSDETINNGKYNGTLFWFPLRRHVSDLSENIYSSKKVEDLFRSFKDEIDLELLFLKSLENIQVYKDTADGLELKYSVAIETAYLSDIRAQRNMYRTKIEEIENTLEENGRALLHENPIWMKNHVRFIVFDGSVQSSQDWLVVQYFHAGNMDEKMIELICNRRSKFRPYLGIAARLDQIIPRGHIFCFLPLPSEIESSTGLPVHVNGFFSLDSNRQHLKWPSHDQRSNEYVENDMLWNQLMVRKVLPTVYIEFLDTLASLSQESESDVPFEVFYQCIPRKRKIRDNWKSVLDHIINHLLETQIPCLERNRLIDTRNATFVVFHDTDVRTQEVVKKLFYESSHSVVNLKNYDEVRRSLMESDDSLKITSPQETRILMRISMGYKWFSASEKSCLLIYSCSDGNFNDLSELELFQTADGIFRSLLKKTRKQQPLLYFCGEKEVEFLCGKEAVLVDKPSSEKLADVLLSVAKSCNYNFQRLSPSSCITFLEDVIELNRKKRGEFLISPGNSNEIFGELWLRNVWCYIRKHYRDSLDPVRHLQIVPSKTKHKIYLQKISEPLINKEDVDALLADVLTYFGIWVVDCNEINHTLMKPGKGIVGTLQGGDFVKLLEKNHLNNVTKFNADCSSSGREHFKSVLPRIHSEKLKSVMRKLDIFHMFESTHANIGYTCLKNCNKVYVGERDFPAPFPEPMVIALTEKDKELADDLSGHHETLSMLVEKSLANFRRGTLMLSQDELRQFCFYVLRKKDYLNGWRNIRYSLNAIQFIKNGTGMLFCAHELYALNSEILPDLFLDEHKFPYENMENTALLQGLEFLTIKSASFNGDFKNTLQFIQKNGCNSRESNVYKKAMAVLKILDVKREFLSDIADTMTSHRIFPYEGEKPENYPQSLQWYFSSNPLVAWSNIFPKKYSLIIGSVLPVATGDSENLLAQKYCTPPVEKVIEHFRNVVNCYNEDEHAEYSVVMNAIYRFLASSDLRPHHIQLLPALCVFTHIGFLRAKDVYIYSDQQDLNLEHYFLPLSKENQAFKSLFKKFGCYERQNIGILVNVLQKIEIKYNRMHTNREVERDLDILRNVLIRLSENEPKLRTGIILPVHTSQKEQILFKSPDECAYMDSDWFSQRFREKENVVFVHPVIPKAVAKSFGARNLKEYTLSDAEEIYTEFGQSEPLTVRLKSILEEGYTDGFSVPKEIIQNADDAGASVVKFLYDERENRNARSCLIDPGMAECQGPAFWAFNDAVFSPDDFKNIQKLSGATKKSDATKIGKFGLGFNAVYNLTDVPSFVSGQNLVYLDPHGKYLGEAIESKESPGIKLNLHNKMMLRELENQFIPFQNVFNFQMSNFYENKTYDGTLFRFPLRTMSQAEVSDICKKYYSRSEMKKLIQMFCEAAGNLLLFTQNVQEIHLYHLPDTHQNADLEKTLILCVTKTDVTQFMTKHHTENIVKTAAFVCNQQHLLETPALAQSKVSIHLWVKDFKDLDISGMEIKLSWVIAWAVGLGKSMKLYNSQKSDGALPLACVAVPVQQQFNDTTPKPLNGLNSTFGFYTDGHIFCYLPLPISTELNFHVNGSFAVSSDRRRLLVKSQDDKDNSRHSVWNSSLMTDAVLEALIALLEFMKINASLDYDYYSLWPNSCGPLWHSFEMEFYRAIVCRNIAVFKTSVGWVAFSKCIFLHPEIRRDERMEAIAFDIISKTHLNTTLSVADIPLDIFENFKTCGCSDELEKQVVTYEKFVTKIFLPNLDKIEETNCNYVILHALRSKNKKILEEMQRTSCIPTQPYGKRKMPCSVIHPRSEIAHLFNKSEGYFPIDMFCHDEDLNTLVDLGMMKREIPWKLLVTQAQSVCDLSKMCMECALNRAKNIVKYINRKRLDSKSIPEETAVELSNTPFLPVMQKPQDWPLIWYANGDKGESRDAVLCEMHKYTRTQSIGFKNPRLLYLPATKNRVACTKPLLGNYEYFHFYHNELQTVLGLNGENSIELETLKFQLLEACGKNTKECESVISSICVSVFDTLEKRIHESEVARFIAMNLSDTQCIVIGTKAVYPKQVVFSIKHDCSPYFFGLANSHLARFTKVLSAVGVRNIFDAEDIISVLNTCKEQCGNDQLKHSELELVCRIAMMLEDHDILDNKNLYLPDDNGMFAHVNDLCINNFDWIPTSRVMRFLNANISLKVAKLAGVKSKREQHLMDDSEPIGDEFGQHEDLTNRIKRILDGYPDISIMKELLQNADDAGAKQLHFIKDFRTHGKEHVFSDEWKELQGPALCVYNDSVFTERDMQGIQNLGIGSKADDPTCTGQYGVGFNAVYHLTDVPTFITRDTKCALDTLCVLDPHCRYIPHATVGKPGRRFKNAFEMLKSNYKDLLPCYLEGSEIWQNGKGTLFRFPLRQNAFFSKLSIKTYSPKDIEELFDAFKSEMEESIVFLHNVKTIIVSSINDTNTIQREFYVHGESRKTEPDNGNIYTDILECRRKMKTNPSFVCEIKRREVKTYLNLDINSEKKQEWLIVSSLGFSDKRNIPENIKKAYASHQLSLLPSAGIAYNLRNKVISYKNETGQFYETPPITFKAYCFLPLPITTGLPVHVNGHFALDHEARRNVWWPDGERMDIKKEWNSCLIENVLVPTYSSTIEHVRKEIFTEKVGERIWHQLKKYHHIFPSVKNMNDKIWLNVLHTLYKQIGKQRIFPIVKREYQSVDVLNDPKDEKNTTSEHKSQLGIKWVPMLTEELSPAFFDNIFYQLKGDFTQDRYKQTAFQKGTSKESEYIGGILKDLGMKIIDSPMWIYDSMKDSGVDVQTVSPKSVLNFLKTFRTNACDRCILSNVDIHIAKTPWKTIRNAVGVLWYCLRDESLETGDFEDAPLLLTADDHIREFTTERKTFYMECPSLLPNCGNEILHLSVKALLTSDKRFPNFIQVMDIEHFAERLIHNIPSKMCTNYRLQWNPKFKDVPNEAWIQEVWYFLEMRMTDFLNTEKMLAKQIDNQDAFVEEVIMQFAGKIKTHLGSLKILPVFLSENEERLTVLYQLSQGNSVIKIKYRIGEVEKIIKTMNIPEVDFLSISPKWTNTMYINKLLKHLVATIDSPENILFCLHTNKYSLCLTNENCTGVLEYFALNLKVLQQKYEHREILRSLPFYTTTTGSLCCLKNQVTIVLCDKFPKSGLEEFGCSTNVTFLQDIPPINDLLKYIGCSVLNDEDIYCDHILKSFRCLPSNSVGPHLSYIWETVIPGLRYSKESEQKMAKLAGVLQSLPFIPTQHGNKCASEFYNPHKDIYKLMCLESELPPAPFNEKYWEEFLIFCGLKSNVTARIFKEFAIRLQHKEEQYGITNDVKHYSLILIQALFSSEWELYKESLFLSSIGRIRFLCPYQMANKYTSVVVQHEKGQKLICYNESALPEHRLLIWSTMGIICEDANPSMHYLYGAKNNVPQSLGISSTSPPQKVISHLRKVCDILHENMPSKIQQSPDIKDVLIEMLNEIYPYLDRMSNKLSIDSLKGIPFIYAVERKSLVTAENVVLDMNEDDEIPPYLFKAPLYFGQYHSVFLKYGASKDLESNHYGKVLFSIYRRSNGEKMEYNERRDTKKAVCKLFSKLQTESSVKLKLEVLFLPSKEHKLVSCSELVFVDNKLLEKRIKNNLPDMKFFIGFKSLDISDDDPMKLLKCLPKKYRPLQLSKVVTETITEESKMSSTFSEKAGRLKRFLHSIEFLVGICRLMRDEMYKKDAEFSPDDQKDIKDSLQRCDVQQVEQLKTVLVYKEEKLADTEEEAILFNCIETDEVEETSRLIIYFTEKREMDLSDWVDSILRRLTIIINRYLGKRLLENCLYLQDILKCIENPRNIEKTLDKYGILSVEMADLNWTPFIPELGTEIPVALHHLLDNTFTFFELDEYVAFELCDPLLEEDDSEDVEPVYILAQIYEIITDEQQESSVYEQEYRIDVGRDTPILVSASRLYKFHRKPGDERSLDVVDGNQQTWDLNRDKRFILEFLRQASRQSKIEYRRRLKRLLLQFHPDKHPENKDYYTDLTQFILFLNGKIERGEDISSDNVLFSAFSNEQFPSSNFWSKCNRRGTSYARDRKHFKGYGGEDFFQDFSRRGSQPGQAKRWMRQARFDLQAAYYDKDQPYSYNWACFKSHQAVEKALKALIYKIDADKVDLKTHRITLLASATDDVNLEGLARKLEGITGSYFRMRYPDAVAGECGYSIPSDIYTNQDARAALECAEDILTIVEARIC